MGARVLLGLIFLLCVLFSSGTLVEEQLFPHSRKQLLGLQVESMDATTQFDVVTPMTTVPVVNPTTPGTTPPVNPTTPGTPGTTTPAVNPTTPAVNPTTPGTTTPAVNPIATPATPVTTPTATPTAPTTTTPISSGGQSWCIASQSASQTALQVALDYACGFGGADCTAIQNGGSCYNPSTVRDHASYAFNDYYQKNPVPTSCSFGGTAVITNIDPSNGGCQYASTSTSSSILNTTNPTGATVFGSVPEPTGGTSMAALLSLNLCLLFTLTCLAMTPVALKLL
ncbi:glucan endo-1,3-beta-glucosidase 12-like [Aristolochia californica]|uniref:glucan endo-1,3-beta-glucosidase 12-like n=1 Tax=Aristolochia californica TaxID=171875 RepID=UPI0035DB6C92